MTPQRYAKLCLQLEETEVKLLRVMRKWEKLRARVKRAEKSLDKEFAARASEIGGKADWTDFDTSTQSGENT